MPRPTMLVVRATEELARFDRFRQEPAVKYLTLPIDETVAPVLMC